MREELVILTEKLKNTSGRMGKAMVTLRWPFEEKQMLPIIDRLHRLKDTAALCISQASHLINRELLFNVGDVKSPAKGNHFKAILSWLTPLNFPQKQQEILGTADSYIWVLESNRFNSWHAGDVRSLWCFGAPGAGKSVLAASLYAELDNMHEAENIAIMIAFCSFDNEESQSLESIAAGLLKQTLQIQGEGKIPPELGEFHSRATNSNKVQTPKLDFFNTIIRKELGRFDSVFIILDGIDEVVKKENRATIIETLHSYGAHVKVLFTSRYSEDIAEAFQRTLICYQPIIEQEKIVVDNGEILVATVAQADISTFSKGRSTVEIPESGTKSFPKVIHIEIQQLAISLLLTCIILAMVSLVWWLLVLQV